MFSGPNEALQFFGVTLIGVTPENGRKLLLTAALVFLAWCLSRLMKGLAGAASRRSRNPRAAFWSRQAIQIVIAVATTIAVISIWFDDPTRLATAAGLITAGLAFAMQRVVTAIAGYFVILRGATFNVGDRIVMGGVRGDVIALGFMQTTVMEMGQPASVSNADPAIWVHGRHYTGRIVTISNAKIFDEPVYNYSREFPFLFEEMSFPVAFDAGERAEPILLAVARERTVGLQELGQAHLEVLQQRYFLAETYAGPRVFWRITDNWLELSLRFLVRDHGVRDVKDAMTRDILSRFQAEGLEIASATIDVVGLPALQLTPGRAS